MSLADLSGGFEDRVAIAVLASVPQRARHRHATARRVIRSELGAMNPHTLLGSPP